MAMTRKDYQILANALHGAATQEHIRNAATLDGIRMAAESVAAMLSMENDKFDVDKFLEATRGKKI